MINSIEFKELQVKDLLVDTVYQQNISKKQCEKIANNFIVNLVKPIEVALRDDGKYYILDGKHLVNVLKLKNVEKTMCRVHSGLNYEEEVKLFLAFHNPKNYSRSK